MVEQGRIFIDRAEAGYELAKLLEAQYKGQNVLVLGIPRGGVVVAYEVARVLNGELSVVITKKLPHPRQEELAIGAVAEDGSVFLSSLAKGISEQNIDRIIKAQEREIQSHIQRFRKGTALPQMANRTVIIVDDGIATGSTIIPAIKLCKHMKAGRVIVAAPVSGENYIRDIDDLADEVVVAEKPELFYAVGQVYEDFHHLSDTEVVSLLDDFEKRKNKT